MKFLKENWFKIALLFILISVVVGSFYWFAWRPSHIRKICVSLSPVKHIYETCLRQNGLEN